MPSQSTRRSRILVVSLVAIAFVIAVSLVKLPGGVDWYESIRPATETLLSLGSPYSSERGINISATAPWGLLLLSPLLAFSPDAGRSLFLVVSLVGFVIALRRMKASAAALVFFLLSPPVLHSLLNANIDWLPILGFTLRPCYGIFLVSLKPQMGSCVIVFWIIQVWSRGGLKAVLREFSPFAAALLLSAVIYGPWFLEAARIADYSQTWNASLWPMSIPVGLLLLTDALRRSRVKSAYAAAPCLSPYVLFHAWSGALSALADNALYMFVTVVGLWILVVSRML
jgi:hypothetical protein